VVADFKWYGCFMFSQPALIWENWSVGPHDLTGNYVEDMLMPIFRPLLQTMMLWFSFRSNNRDHAVQSAFIYWTIDDYRFLMGFMIPTSATVKESICFYGGEESEAERLEKLYVPWKELVAPGIRWNCWGWVKHGYPKNCLVCWFLLLDPHPNI
jgi:hypothetical protein